MTTSLRYATRRFLGPALTNRLGNLKHFLQRSILGSYEDATLRTSLPWCSPNTFDLIVAAYRRTPSPYVHEYGSGASTLWHLKVLLTTGGTLVSVEHDAKWALRVSDAAKEILPNPFPINAHTVRNGRQPGSPRSGSEIEFCTRATNGVELRFALKVRPPDGRRLDPDGTADEFRDYVFSLDRPADIVIVDGRARKACVRHVLDNQLLRSGGSLALFEAGRGAEGWLDAPALQGTSNYQPEVERMLNLGGILVDGTGYDSWPGQLKRRSFGSLSMRYPSELCLLQLPDGKDVEGASFSAADRV
jgi:hypothetical protein